MIKVIKKEDVLKRLDDPKWDYVERHLREYQRHKKALAVLIEERPSRRDKILLLDRTFAIELETSAQAG